MRRSMYSIIAAVLATALLRVPAVLGSETEQASYRTLAAMENRLAELEAQLASYQQVSYEGEESYLPPDPNSMQEPGYMPDGGYAGCDSCQSGGGYYAGSYDGGYGCGSCGCGDCCGGGCYGGGCYDGGYGCGDGYGCEPSCGCYDQCGNSRRGGWVGSAEILMLRPQDSGYYQSQPQFDSGSRYTLGYTNGRGQTLRARYFEFEANEVGSGDYTLGVDVLDLECAGEFCLGSNWTGEIGGGVRWAKIDHNSSNELKYDDSVGPVIGAELRSCPWFHTSLFLGVRQSFQFGSPYYQNGSSVSEEDLGSFGITEMQVGLQWNGCWWGYHSYLRTTFEAQQWQGLADDGYDDQRLIGGGLSIGITR